MLARDYSPRSTFHTDAKILDGLSGTRNLSSHHSARSLLVGQSDMWFWPDRTRSLTAITRLWLLVESVIRNYIHFTDTALGGAPTAVIITGFI